MRINQQRPTDEEVAKSILFDIKRLPEVCQLVAQIKVALIATDVNTSRKNFLDWLLTGKYTKGVLTGGEIEAYLNHQNKVLRSDRGSVVSQVGQSITTPPQSNQIRSNPTIIKILQLVEHYKDHVLNCDDVRTKFINDYNKSLKYQSLRRIVRLINAVTKDINHISLLNGLKNGKISSVILNVYRLDPEAGLTMLLDSLKDIIYGQKFFKYLKSLGLLGSTISEMMSEFKKRDNVGVVSGRRLKDVVDELAAFYNVPEAPDPPVI